MQAAEVGLTMSAVLRHLVSGATRRAGLPAVAAPPESGPLPGSVGGISRPFPRGAPDGSLNEGWPSDEDEEGAFDEEEAGEAPGFGGRDDPAFVPYQDREDLASWAELQVSATRPFSRPLAPLASRNPRPELSH